MIPPALAMSMGIFFKPGIWYTTLSKPWWTPPNLAFPIVWTLLYFLMGISLFILAKRGELKTPQGYLFGIQLLLNAAWSPLFFGFHFLGLSLVVLFSMWVVVGFLVGLFFKQKQRDQGLLLIPYLTWLSIALSLNTFIFIYN
jgi:tryptophan-rich sensory protein